MRPLLSLVMIVKDEAASIRKVLEEVRPFIDRWTILDTGSSDGTQDIIKEVLGEWPGALHEETFIDFAASRNRVMDIDARSDWPAEFQLMLSGDEYLKDGVKVLNHLQDHRETTVDCHWLKISVRGVTLFTPRIFRTDSDWHYEGVVHECPMNRKDPKAPMANIYGASIEHIESDIEKRYNNIWEVHIPLLKKALEENPNDERALIFLAQSYECLFHGFDAEELPAYAAEALDLRRRRLEIPTGTPAERNYVMFHALDDARLTGMFSNEELCAWAESLAKEDLNRPETALLFAELAIPVKPLHIVYELARNAAEVSARAHLLDNSSPVDGAIGWKAHRLAAVAARQLAMRRASTALEFAPSDLNVVATHIHAGLALGGPPWMFEGLALNPAPDVEPRP